MEQLNQNQKTNMNTRRSSISSQVSSSKQLFTSKLYNNIHNAKVKDAEVFLNIYGLKPTTIPPFALIIDKHDYSTNTQRKFNEKRHNKQKEKFNKLQEPKPMLRDGRSSMTLEDPKEDNNEENNSPGQELDSQMHWNKFIENLTCTNNTSIKQSPIGSPKISNKYIKNVASQDVLSSQSSRSSSSSSSDCDVDSRIKVKPGHPLYNELMPTLNDRWRGEDRLKIMESIPYIEECNFKTLQEKNEFNSYVNELKTNFYSDKNYYNDWDLDKMEQEKKNVLEKNKIDEDKIATPHNMNNINSSFYYRNSVDRTNSRSTVNGHPNYGNMEPRDLEKVYHREHNNRFGINTNNKNYHMSMLQKKENITEYFKQQYGKKKTQFLPSIEKILFQNRYVPLFCRLFIVVLCVIALSLSSRIYVNSKGSYYGNSLTGSTTSSTTLEKYTLGQQPSTIMAIVVNSIAILFELFVAIDEFKGEPLGLRNPLGKLRLILLDLLFIIFSSANLALAFGSMFDDDWVCIKGVPSMKSSPKINYICRKQRTLSSFLFLILCSWVITFTISIVRVVNKASSLQR
ncbi:hypothetical protein HANVADRAFT_53383 [Hanseniaspora valbyensis NRRL Y-1626]|uniref:Regulator of phospholipase D SRF1 n=1 Tax=Hanseniaspora valbyensis NRRL Y-1626 TaxID=766949 RepID=A0A1B7TBN8_9ASCO|nr:hypothetical protein HANVADRAFT_53383 [Hanseniaspora valbyensis NRRL Y-1626]